MAKFDKHPQLKTRAMKTYFIKDTMEAYYNPHDYCIAPYFIGLTTAASIARETSIEKIHGGLHNQVIAIQEIDEGMTITVETALFYADDMELKFGHRAKDGKVTINDIQLLEDGTFSDEEKEVQGSIIDLEAGAFAQNGHLQLHTLAYDAEKGDKVVADVYYVFPNVKPASSFEQSFTMGENTTQSIEFTPQVMRAEKTYGKYIVVPREAENNEDKTCGFDTEEGLGE